MPILTFFKTMDVTRLARISKQTGLKFNMLMCWCIGKAASNIKEFYMLPAGRKLMQYDNLGGSRNSVGIAIQLSDSEEKKLFVHDSMQVSPE